MSVRVKITTRPPQARDPLYRTRKLWLVAAVGVILAWLALGLLARHAVWYETAVIVLLRPAQLITIAGFAYHVGRVNQWREDR